MARTIRRAINVPSWEADKMSRQARKEEKQNRKVLSNKRKVQLDNTNSYEASNDDHYYDQEYELA